MTMLFPTPSPPAGMTILQAMAIGLLPAQVQVTNFGGPPSPTLASLISAGVVNPSALASTLSYATSANYGGT